jgi:oxidase EvaA
MNLEDQFVLKWRLEQVGRSHLSVRRITWKEMRKWKMERGNLRHESGGFFSVVGMRFGEKEGAGLRSQPFILQPEIGILGFLMGRDTRGVRLLVQGKTEPGNIGGTQLAPSFQCTKSNYELRHGGEIAPFSEYFLQVQSRSAVTDVLQSEQGTRFIDKYNRNMVVSVPVDSIDLSSPQMLAWRWLPIELMSRIITQDFLLNTDARSVFSTTDWAEFCEDGEPFGRWRGQAGFGEQLWRSYHAPVDASSQAAFRQWLRDQQQAWSREIEVVGLDELPGWALSSEGLEPRVSDGGPLVRYYAVEADDREVVRWTQPLITSDSSGLVLLVARIQQGVLKFGTKLSPEPGFKNGAQLSVTLQVFPGERQRDGVVEELCAQVEAFAGKRAQVVFDCQLSEEGGRFFQEINRYVVMVLPEGCSAPDEENLSWLSLAAISALKRESGVFTNEFRSILSLLLAYL